MTMKRSSLSFSERHKTEIPFLVYIFVICKFCFERWLQPLGIHLNLFHSSYCLLTCFFSNLFLHSFVIHLILYLCCLPTHASQYSCCNISFLLDKAPQSNFALVDFILILIKYKEK